MSKLTDKLKQFRLAHPTLCEIVRFLIVGGLATLIDMFVMGVVLYAFDPSLYPAFYNVWIGGKDPSTAATVVGTCCGFIAGLIVNYILSVIFVFDNKGKSKTALGFVAFTALSAIGLAIHIVGMYIGYDLLKLNEWAVKIFLTVVVLVYNYISKRLILFKKPTDNKGQAGVDAAVAATTSDDAPYTNTASGDNNNGDGEAA